MRVRKSIQFDAHGGQRVNGSFFAIDVIKWVLVGDLFLGEMEILDSTFDWGELEANGKEWSGYFWNFSFLVNGNFGR